MKAHRHDLGKGLTKEWYLPMVLDNSEVQGSYGDKKKNVMGWHVEAHGWCTSEGKDPLVKEERVRLVYGL